MLTAKTQNLRARCETLTAEIHELTAGVKSLKAENCGFTGEVQKLMGEI